MNLFVLLRCGTHAEDLGEHQCGDAVPIHSRSIACTEIPFHVLVSPVQHEIDRTIHRFG